MREETTMAPGPEREPDMVVGITATADAEVIRGPGEEPEGDE